MFHIECEFLLWSPIWSSLAFRCSALCLPISSGISLLRVVMRVSVGFVARSMFLSFMMSLMCLGSGWFNFLSLPLGMWCLSARRMRLVSVLFAECTLSGVEASWKECSISVCELFPVDFPVVLERFAAGRKPEIAFGVDGDDDWYVIRG